MGSSPDTLGSESRLGACVEALTRSFGHADRAAPFRHCCTGLLLPGARKSVEPMAARVEPGRVQAAHQSLHHFVAKADWSDEALVAGVRNRALPVIEQRGPIRGWMIDDAGIPKKGMHSVGVARQHCGQLGKQDNCQVAVTLSLAAAHASLPIAHRLCLPQTWADDPARRAAAGVPADITFQTKPQIALAQISAAVTAGVAQAPVLADAGHGIDTAFRDGITALGLTYVVGVQSHTSLWPPGMEPLPPKPWSGRGRPTSLVRRDAEHAPMPAKALAASLPKRAWRRLTWREGTNTTLAGRFAAVRVRPAHRDCSRPTHGPRSGCWSNGPRASRSLRNAGSLACRPQSRAGPWSTKPSCAGASNATIRTSSRNSVLVTTRGEDGAASTITRRCASQPMASSSPNAALSPLGRVLAAIPQSTCPTQRLQTPRRSRSGLSAISPLQ